MTFHKLGLLLSWCNKEAIEASQTEGIEFSIHFRSGTAGAVPRLKGGFPSAVTVLCHPRRWTTLSIRGGWGLAIK